MNLLLKHLDRPDRESIRDWETDMGFRQDHMVVGNIEDKEHLRNPIARWLVRRFDETLLECLRVAEPTSVHEVGCGEGRLARMIASLLAVRVRASDVSTSLTERCRLCQPDGVEFVTKSIYNLQAPEDCADVVVCCEVLEHLAVPQRALTVLQELQANYYVFSVPREPVWRMLNVCRGKYLRGFGDTPGHVNHWSKRSFIRFLQDNGFWPNLIRSPLPWTMVLGTFET